MQDKLREIEERYQELSHLLADADVLKDQTRYMELAREHAALEDFMGPWIRLKAILEDIEEHELMLDDSDLELRDLAREGLPELRQLQQEIEQELKVLFIPRDPNDTKNVILEIRAGTGGEEAGLFSADLFRMYTRYAEARGWKVDLLSANETGIGGFKEVVACIEGRDVYSRLKYESGVHRVQRVPVTETGGRIHTSACTVAVLPEAADVEVNIEAKDLRIDTYRASGAGGQHVNKTESAIRITHIPTGLVVTCQDEKSQHKNKAKAMKVLQSRLLQRMEDEAANEMATERRSQVGSGDRSERIRTYNFPQGRVTDHRINLTLHKLPQILEGELDEVVDELATYYQAEALKHLEG